ncbi:related to secretory pathway protein (exocyst complex protein Sec15) [Ramularia collo-cygni]|uniref:Exocyst complex component SEC15 n=1 Tax=Ramularia collo-cygni TaxID=112498 RepID=A0A2D3V595_9PEZI|nr:related to secretory pathway protein (exocyst complex protein Sec15) [Ramularia collo-cygni]CZT21865.1 related to secretory pathway protein (exocyst complex protein Sec15) [Ramularia collo-cygni]
MPGVIAGSQYDDLTGAVQQIILSSSDSDYLDQLIPLLKNAETQTQVTPLIQALNHVSADREHQIERICNSNHTEFISSVNQLQSVREETVTLTAEIMELSRSIEATTEKLAETKKALVDSRGVRQNIDDATQALKDCLEVLRLANQVHDLLGKKNHYAALRALDELQNVHLREVTRYKIAEMIERSVPATQRLIADAVMADLNTWLYRIRETSQFLGEVAFYHTEMRRARQRERGEKDEYLGSFKLNSPVELVADESEEFDVLNNDEVQVDFSPLFECLHIHDALGQTEKFRADYAATRRRQKDLLIPQTINLLDDENSSLSSLLEGIAGFAIVEKATMQKTENFRSQSDVDELWDSMCQSAVALISSALHNVDNDDRLLKIKGVIALFIQTMDSWSYPISSLDTLLLTLFDKYSSLLKTRFSDDFQEIVSTDDYMPMPINDADEYNKVISVSWYTPPADLEITYPCILPFSQMYPLVCIDIRNFLNQIYLFSDDHFRHTTTIDKTLKESLDELLVDKVCRTLVERLASQYPGQIVQILTNLDHFEQACQDLQSLLVEARSSSSAAGPIKLAATTAFRDAKKTAEKRIFELVNSKIDDLIETAEYDWLSTYVPQTASPYIQELTRYLSNIMSSVLLGLPEGIKKQIYYTALQHIGEQLMSLPLEEGVTRISPQAVGAYKMDVEDLVEFVKALPEAESLISSLEKLRQTTALMELAATGKGEEFFDSSKSNERFGEVDKLKGAELIDRVGSPGAGEELQPPGRKRENRMSFLPDMSMEGLGKKPSMNFEGFGDRFRSFGGKRDRT